MASYQAQIVPKQMGMKDFVNPKIFLSCVIVGKVENLRREGLN